MALDHRINLAAARMQGLIITIAIVFALQWLIRLGLRKAGFKWTVPRGWTFWLIFLGVSAAMTMVATSIISVFMISIIGIPIALYLMAAPFLFLVVLGTYLLRRFTGTDWMGTIAALVATLGLLAVPPYVANGKLEMSARAQVAGDRDDGTKPTGRVIAVRAPKYYRQTKDALNCDGFCQRALMNGGAERVLIVEQDMNVALEPSSIVDSFRLEQRASCPPVNLPQVQDPVEIQEERKDWKGKRVDDLMQLEIAKGNCLIAQKVPLGTADIVLSVGTSKKGDNARSAGLALFADTVKADRIAMHERQGADFVETYRKTFVTTYKIAPLYAPTAESGSELRMHPALLRLRETINIQEKYYDKPDWTAFLTQRLGYDLALRRSGADAETRTVLKDAVLRTGEASSVPAPVAENFFEGINSKNKMDAADFALARQLFEDERFPIARSASAAIRNAQGAGQDYFDAIAIAMFKRLRVHAAAGTVKPGSGWHEELSAVGNVLAAMPRATILKHRVDLDWLSREGALRVQTYVALQRFADFGADGVEPLIFLIDDAQRFRETNDNAWQHPYLAGLIGLCKLGTEGSAAIQPLFDRLDSGVIRRNSNYSEIATNALVGMGVSADEIWVYVKPDAPNKIKTMDDMRKRFDRDVERARKRVDCSY